MGKHRQSRLKRRQFVAGVAAYLGAGKADTAVANRHVASWDLSTDVIVVGSGAAGLCAALQAREAGAEVLVLEALPQPGGSSVLSAGVVYAGGGTALQRALGVADSPQAMYTDLSRVVRSPLSAEKVALYCDQSVEHFAWLAQQGVPYRGQLHRGHLPPDVGASLYYSANELRADPQERGVAVARGHVADDGSNGGGRPMMGALLSKARAQGIAVRVSAPTQQLVVESDGGIVGVQATIGGALKSLRARRGVILACGGFVHNRAMLSRHLPQLQNCSTPWSGIGDTGTGIAMGAAVGAETLQMEQAVAIAPLATSESAAYGILVNERGQRFVSEDAHDGKIGYDIAFRQGGKCWLLADRHHIVGLRGAHIKEVALANTIGDIASRSGFPRGALQHTVAFYNKFAKLGEDPLFAKSSGFLKPIQGPPYRLFELSVSDSFFPVYTLGGLHTRITGEVVDTLGNKVPNLYAAGRTTAGLPAAPYVVGGLSLADATFFGRQAGRSAGLGRAS